MKKNQTVIRTTLFLLLVTFIFCAFYAGIHSPRREKPYLQQGYANLFGFELETKLAVLPEAYFDYYPNVLHFPEELARESAMQQPEAISAVRGWKDYGTYHMTLALPVGQTYGISAYSARHSQRLFVNGEELSVMGFPGITAQNTIPESGRHTVYFTPETDLTEILIQTANFHHAGNYGLNDLLLGTEKNIQLRQATVHTQIYMLEGGIMTAFILCAGVYLFFQRRINLWFSLACFAVFIRIAIMEENNLLDFFPSMYWETVIRLEYLSTLMLMFCFALYIKNVFPIAFHRTVMTVFVIGCGLFALWTVFMPLIFYTKAVTIGVWLNRIFWLYAGTSLIRFFILQRKGLRVDQVLLFAGTLLFISFFLMDSYLYQWGGYNMSLGLLNLGMIIFVYLNTIALVIDYSSMLNERDAARMAEQEIRETNLLIDRLNRVRSEFLQNLSHELRTPLTVMSNCAGLTALQIRQNALDEDTLEHMAIIKREASRLGIMVEQLKEISVEKEWHLTLAETNARTLLQRTADFCDPICRKNENKIDIVAEASITMHVNADSIFQVLLNLIINANRHTHKDTIVLKAEQLPSGDICISVIDRGDGIPTHLMPRIYERHVSGDGGSGLGLPICKEIVEEHGGTMEIQSAPYEGTVIHLYLPTGKKAENGRNDSID